MDVVDVLGLNGLVLVIAARFKLLHGFFVLGERVYEDSR